MLTVDQAAKITASAAKHMKIDLPEDKVLEIARVAADCSDEAAICDCIERGLAPYWEAAQDAKLKARRRSLVVDVPFKGKTYDDMKQFIRARPKDGKDVCFLLGEEDFERFCDEMAAALIGPPNDRRDTAALWKFKRYVSFHIDWVTCGAGPWWKAEAEAA